MRKNISKVIAAFKARREMGDCRRSCSTDGTTIYSYRMPIARRLGNGSIVILAYASAPTATTRSQVSAMHVEFGSYARVVESIDASYEFQDLAGVNGRLDRHRALKAPSARKAPRRAEVTVGYQHCGCRDCMETVIGPLGTICGECVEAGCDALYTECRRTDRAAE